MSCLAKMSAQEAPQTQHNDKSSHAALKKLLVKKKREIEEIWWRNHCPVRHRNLQIQLKPLRKYPEELQLSREIYASLIAVQNGHGDFKA